jgi:hypothetical protein
LQVRGSDYVATTGTTVTGLTALTASDVVMVESIVAYSVGDTYTQSTLDGKFSPITTTGLVLVSSSTFSAVSSVTVSNCFSSSYDNYKIVLANTASSGNPEIYLRLRVSGTDTSANYKSVRIFSVNGGTPTGGLSPTGTDEFFIGQLASGSPTLSATTLELMNPQKAQATSAFVQFNSIDGANLVSNFISGYQSDTTQFDSASIIASTGTFAGTIKVYGYK